MKLKLLFTVLAVSFMLGCKKTPPPNTPQAGVVQLGTFTARIGGSLSGINIVDKGVCWGLSENPDLNGNTRSAGSGSEPFDVLVTGLNSKVNYFARTYAVNEAGTVYSANIKFTTLAAVNLTTNAVSGVTTNSAVCSGLLGPITTFTPTEKGICWNTTGNPSVNNNKVTSSISTSSSFTAIINNLSTNTMYHIRAYASSDQGVVYGNEISFRTLGEQASDMDGNKYNTITIGTQVWMVENLRVSRYRNGDPVPARTSSSWAAATQDALGTMDDEPSYAGKYGFLYNHTAVTDVRNLAPDGWHIPSQAEWETLINFLGGDDVAAPKLMSEAYGEWPMSSAPVRTDINESRFTALAGGWRNSSGIDDKMFWWGYFWTKSTTASTTAAAIRIDGALPATIGVLSIPKKSGLSIRCVKD